MSQSIKRYLTSVFTAFLVMMSAQYAHALPNANDVEQAVRAGNYSGAESMLKSILEVKPDSARAHYNLGQVLEMQNKHTPALAEMKKAQELDKSLSFANSPTKYFELLEKIEINAGVRVAPTAPVVSNQTVAPTTIQTVAMPKKTAAQIADEQHKKQVMGYSLFITLFVLITIVGGLWLFSRRNYRLREEQAARERQMIIKKDLGKLLDVRTKMKSFELEVRSSPHSAEYKSKLLERHASLNRKLMDAIEEAKDGNSSYTTPRNFETQFEQLESDLAKTPASVSQSQASSFMTASSSSRGTVGATSPRSQTTQKSTKQAPPAPVRTTHTERVREVHHHHNNSSSDNGVLGFAAGLAVASAFDSGKSESSSFDSGRESSSRSSSSSSSSYDSGSSSSGSSDY